MAAQRKPKTEATDSHLKVLSGMVAIDGSPVGAYGDKVDKGDDWRSNVLAASDDLSTILQNLNAVMTLLSLTSTRAEVACNQVYCLLLPIQQGLDRIEAQLEIE